MIPTPEQRAILDAARSDASLMISAYAGTGKTTTLVMLAQELRAQLALALAFNVKIKKELERRFPQNFTVKTLNGLGHSAWTPIVGRVELDDRKIGKILTELLRKHPGAPDDWWSSAKQLVAAAQAQGLTPSAFTQVRGLVTDSDANWAEIASQLYIEPEAPLLALAREALTQSCKLAIGASGRATISYDDQLYMPTFFGGRFTKYPVVMIDEAQDLSPLQHEMVRRSAAGRLIVVGDPRQAIYAFRGADSDSIRKLRALREAWIDLKLSVTFRCPRSIVARQQDHAPGYTAAEHNVDGEIVEFEEWTAGNITLHDNVAVLCRNNGPLISLAMKLLRQRIPVVMLGRDIGKNLEALAKKIAPDDSTPREAVARSVQAWRERESEAARALEHESKLAGIEDRAACLLAVLEFAETAGALRAELRDLFARDTGKITLSSIHRAKGLEWETVMHLDPWRIPSRFARKAASRGDRAQLEQEFNLKYVAETRAKHTLLLANLEDFS